MSRKPASESEVREVERAVNVVTCPSCDRMIPGLTDFQWYQHRIDHALEAAGRDLTDEQKMWLERYTHQRALVHLLPSVPRG